MARVKEIISTLCLRERILTFHLAKNSGQKLITRSLSTDFVQEIANGLSTFISSQERALEDAESRFLQLGQEMQALYAETSGLTQQIRDSAELIGGSGDDSVLSRLGRSVSGSLTTLEDCQKDVGVCLQQVEAVGGRFNEFHHMCPVLEKIAMFLRVIGLNLCIECSQSREATELFMANAHEIKKFAENVIEITEKIREDSQKARINLISMYGEIAIGQKQMQNLADTATRIVQEAFQKIEDLMNISLNAMEQAGLRSQTISQEIGEIVMGIQFHDNMSQRIEHIHETLSEVAGHCETDNFAAEPEEKKTERIADARTIIVLQSGQIREIISEIEEVYQQHRGAFSEIGNEVEGLAGMLVSLTSREVQDSHSSPNPVKKEDPFATLQLAIFELKQLLGHGSEQFMQIQKVGMDTSATASRLLNHIDQVRVISHKTHIQSLNSIIKANQLGEKGRTIEVLANEIKTLSSQSDIFVADVEKIHDFISKAIVTLQVQTVEDTSGSRFNTTSLDREIEESTKAYDQFVANSTTTLQNAGALDDKISQISSGLDFLPVLAQALRENLRQLDELVERLTPWTGEMSDELKTEASRLAERYTMAKERIVHQQLFADSEDENVNDSMDDLEMFDSFESNAVPDNSKIIEDDSDLDGLELFVEDDDDNLDNFEIFVDGLLRILGIITPFMDLDVDIIDPNIDNNWI